jgi:hypothetical protein
MQTALFPRQRWPRSQYLLTIAIAVVLLFALGFSQPHTRPIGLTGTAHAVPTRILSGQAAPITGYRP